MSGLDSRQHQGDPRVPARPARGEELLAGRGAAFRLLDRAGLAREPADGEISHEATDAPPGRGPRPARGRGHALVRRRRQHHRHRQGDRPRRPTPTRWCGSSRPRDGQAPRPARDHGPDADAVHPPRAPRRPRHDRALPQQRPHGPQRLLPGHREVQPRHLAAGAVQGPRLRRLRQVPLRLHAAVPRPPGDGGVRGRPAEHLLRGLQQGRPLRDRGRPARAVHGRRLAPQAQGASRSR